MTDGILIVIDNRSGRLDYRGLLFFCKESRGDWGIAQLLGCIPRGG